MKYVVYSIDVWAGEEEGTYIKNNFFEIGHIDLPEDFSSQHIINNMIVAGLLISECTLLDVEITNSDCEGFYIEITDSLNQRPLFDLKRI